MQLHTHLKSVFRKTALAAVALGGLLCLGGAASTQARDRDCRRVADYYDWRIHEAAERHGFYSRQANHWRHERHEALEHCWRGRDRY